MDSPSTPPHRAMRSSLEDSPFSDYHTDYSLSPDISESSMNSQSILLKRINLLGPQLLRSDLNPHTAAILASKLDAIDALLTAPEPQSRQPAELVDSGLFLEEDFETLGLQAGDVTVKTIPGYVPEAVVNKMLSDVAQQLQAVKMEHAQGNAVMKVNYNCARMQLEYKTLELAELRDENDRLKAWFADLEYHVKQLSTLPGPHTARLGLETFPTRETQDASKMMEEIIKVNCQEADLRHKISYFADETQRMGRQGDTHDEDLQETGAENEEIRAKASNLAAENEDIRKRIVALEETAQAIVTMIYKDGKPDSHPSPDAQQKTKINNRDKEIPKTQGKSVPRDEESPIPGDDEEVEKEVEERLSLWTQLWEAFEDIAGIHNYD